MCPPAEGLDKELAPGGRGPRERARVNLESRIGKSGQDGQTAKPVSQNMLQNENQSGASADPLGYQARQPTRPCSVQPPTDQVGRHLQELSAAARSGPFPFNDVSVKKKVPIIDPERTTATERSWPQPLAHPRDGRHAL